MRVVVVPGLVLAMKYLKSLAELTSVVPHHLLLYCHLDLRNTKNVLLWSTNSLSYTIKLQMLVLQDEN